MPQQTMIKDSITGQIPFNKTFDYLILKNGIKKPLVVKLRVLINKVGGYLLSHI